MYTYLYFPVGTPRDLFHLFEVASGIGQLLRKGSSDAKYGYI